MAAVALAIALAGCTAGSEPEGSPDAVASSTPDASVQVADVAALASPAPQASSSAEPPGVRWYGLQPTPRAVIRAANKMEFTAFAKHPEEWGGCYISGNVVVVNTVTRSVAEAEQRVLELVGDASLFTVVQVDHSITDLKAATELIGDHVVGDWARDTHIVSWGPEYNGARLHLGVDGAQFLEAEVARVREALANADPALGLADIEIKASVMSRSSTGGPIVDRSAPNAGDDS